MLKAGLIFIIASFVPVIVLSFNGRSFFNVKNVIKDYLGIFKECKSQYFVFFGTPLLLAVGMAMIYDSTKDFYNNLSVIISIILSMLFAILAILTNYDYSTYKDERVKERIQKVVTETINSIVFESLICVFLLIYGMLILIFQDVFEIAELVNRILTGIACFLFSALLLNLLVVIKRISKIMIFKTNERC